MAIPYNPGLSERAKELRKTGRLCEVVLWKQLHQKKFKQLDFDRQKIIGNYIVDFYCGNCSVVIEIDNYDAERTAFFEDLRLTVIYISENDVLYRLENVMRMLYNHPALRAPLLGGE